MGGMDGDLDAQEKALAYAPFYYFYIWWSSQELEAQAQPLVGMRSPGFVDVDDDGMFPLML